MKYIYKISQGIAPATFFTWQFKLIFAILEHIYKNIGSLDLFLWLAIYQLKDQKILKAQ
jgi:hypothetical protein